MTDASAVDISKRGNGLGITSLVFGILAAIGAPLPSNNPSEDISYLALFFSVLGALFGIASLFQSRMPKGRPIAGVLLAVSSAFFIALHWSGMSKVKAPPVAVQAPTPPITPQAPVISPVESKWTPSYDCQKVASGPERLVCSNQELSSLDVQLNEAYALAAKRVPDRSILKSEQLAWLKNVRDQCSDADCMKHAYGLRLVDLRAK